MTLVNWYRYSIILMLPMLGHQEMSCLHEYSPFGSFPHAIVRETSTSVMVGLSVDVGIVSFCENPQHQLAIVII